MSKIKNFFLNIIHSKILVYRIAYFIIFIISISLISINPYKYGKIGIILCMAYWIFYLIHYTRVYKYLKHAVKSRFPDVYPYAFSDEPGFKNKYLNLEDWDTTTSLVDMYNYDLNIQNTYLKIKEFDKFKYTIFIMTILVMLITMLLH